MLYQCKSDFFERDTLVVAKDLIGCLLKGKGFEASIIETEAYLGQNDEASHASKGVTPRTQIMFENPGFIYIYLIYGMYYCLNFVCEKKGIAGAVLIRGLKDFRGKILDGPGKLTRYYQITKEKYHGKSLVEKDSLLRVYKDSNLEEKVEIITTTRIGIRCATDLPYRFLLKNTEIIP